MINPRARIADFAESQIGTQEDSAHSNRGAAILKYQQATSLGGQGWPWCAAFVDWNVMQAEQEHPDLFELAARPRTASAFGLIDYGNENHCLVFTPQSPHYQPERGDIVVYTFSHCGIVAGTSGTSNVKTVEGNTNDDGSRDGYEVCAKVRPLTSVRAFIRLPVKGLPFA